MSLIQHAECLKPADVIGSLASLDSFGADNVLYYGLAAIDAIGEQAENHNLMQITAFCAIVYGTLGLGWFSFSRLPKDHEKRDTFELGLLCITFMSMSAGMAILNKALVSTLKTPSLITAAQMVMAVVALTCMSFQQLMESNPRQLLMWLIIPGLFAAILISSSYTYQFISLSLLTVVRNLAPLVSLTAETLLMPKEKAPAVNVLSVCSILIMLVGASVYAGSLASFSVVGILLAVLNLCLAITENMTSRRLLTEECNGLPLQICTLVNNFFWVDSNTCDGFPHG